MINKYSVDSSKVYIIDSDKTIVEHINRLLLHKGIVTITDAVGNMYFMIDARSGAQALSKHITEMAIAEDEEKYSYGAIIHRVFASHGFNSALIGTMLLQHIVKNRITNKEIINDLKGEIYKAAKSLNISGTSAIRDIRYAINHSNFANDGLRTGKVLAALTYDTNVVIQDMVVGYKDKKDL